MFEGSMLIKIYASNEDVQMYLDARISHGQSRILQHPDLQAEITAEITKAIDGMWVKPKLNNLFS